MGWGGRRGGGKGGQSDKEGMMRRGGVPMPGHITRDCNDGILVNDDSKDVMLLLMMMWMMVVVG